MSDAEEVKDRAFGESRRNGIWSTDVGPILKLSRFGYGPLDVALSKLHPRRHPPSLRMRLGTYLEPFVAQLYHEDTGHVLEPAPAQGWQHAGEAWMNAHGDYAVPATPHLLEVKTTSVRAGWGDEGTDQVPADILLQAQWEMACSGNKTCDIAVLFSNERLLIYTVPFNHVLLELAVRICGDFWRMLQRGVIPAPDWSDPRTAELIPKLYLPVPDKVVELPAEALGLVDEMERLGRAEGEAGKGRGVVKARLIHLLGDGQRGLLPDGLRELRRAMNQNRLTVARRKS